MSGKPGDFKLVEFQPKMVYLPEHANGTYPRPGSAEERDRPGENYRGDPSRYHPEAREPEYARVQHRGHPEFDTYPRPVGLDYRGAHGPEDPKQPLLANPVWVLVPTDAVPQRTAPLESVYTRLDGSPPSDGRGIRRRPIYVREKEEVRYGEKGCCSCWKCAIATIVIMTLLGVGIAVTGIVYINLVILGQNRTVSPDSLSPNDNVIVETRRGGMAFDVDLPRNDTITVVDGPFPLLAATNASAVLANASADWNSSIDGNLTFDLYVRTVPVVLAPGNTHLNVSISQHQNPSFDIQLSPSGNDSNATVFDVDAVFGDNWSTTTFPNTTFQPITPHPGSAFHHTIADDLASVNASVSKVLGEARDALGNEQRKIEAAQRLTGNLPIMQGQLFTNGSMPVKNITTI